VTQPSAERRVLIVDDEEPARRLLVEYLRAHPRWSVIGQAKNGLEAVQLTQELKPDLLLLDVQMPKIDGFEVLGLIPPEIAVVFTTAFDEYAVRAFEVHALDYLLKPVHPARLSEALARARHPAEPHAAPQRPATYRYDDFFFHDAARRPCFIRIREIAFIRAAGNYTELYTAAGPSLLVLRSLSTWEAQLADTPFVRVHRSALVNLDFIERIERGTSYTYELYVRGHAVPLAMSRRRAMELRSRRDVFGGLR